MRFNEILRIGEVDGLNARTLSRSLKVLAEQGLVNRELIETQPFAVQYTLTDKGQRFGRLLSGFRELDEDPSLRDVQL